MKRGRTVFAGLFVCGCLGLALVVLRVPVQLCLDAAVMAGLEIDQDYIAGGDRDITIGAMLRIVVSDNGDVKHMYLIRGGQVDRR